MVKKRKALKATIPPVPVDGSVELPEGFKVKRQVTLPSLAIKVPGQVEVLRINDAMRISKIQDKPDATGKQRDPATICTAMRVNDGQMFTLIVPAVVKSNLERDYPDDTYVGLVFYIKNMGKRATSQRYNDFSILEIEQ